MAHRFRDETTWKAIDAARDQLAEENGSAEASRRQSAWIEARTAELLSERLKLQHDRVVAVQTRITEAFADLVGAREIGREFALGQRDALTRIDTAAQREKAYEQACREAEKIDFRVEEAA